MNHRYFENGTMSVFNYVSGIMHVSCKYNTSIIYHIHYLEIHPVRAQNLRYTSYMHIDT